MSNPHAHCGHCGTIFTIDSWPRTCAACNKMTWRNPTPVVVGLIRTVSGGVVVIRRGISPFKGGLALPGGFQEIETWQQALTRELDEELRWREQAAARGLTPPDLNFKVFDVLSSTHRDMILIFAYSDPVEDSFFNELPPTEEAEEILILHKPEVLCFSTHSWVLGEILKGNLQNDKALWDGPPPLSPSSDGTV